MPPEIDTTTTASDASGSNRVEPDDARAGRVDVGHIAPGEVQANAPTVALIDGDTIGNLQAADVLVHHVIARLQTGGLDDQVTIADLRATAVVAQSNIEQLERDGTIDRAEIFNLKQALATARRIGAAIGIIMAVKKVTEEQAFTVLCEKSQRGNRKLRDVADTILMTGAV